MVTKDGAKPKAPTKKPKSVKKDKETTAQEINETLDSEILDVVFSDSDGDISMEGTGILTDALIDFDSDKVIQITGSSIKDDEPEIKEMIMEEKPVAPSEKEVTPEIPKKVEPKIKEVRVLYKKCLACSYLVPWAEDINSCIDDPECPAKKIQFLNGRDPVKLIDTMSDEFAKSLSEGDKEAFMESLKRMVKDKTLREYIFESFSLSIQKLEELATTKKVKDVPL